MSVRARSPDRSSAALQNFPGSLHYVSEGAPGYRRRRAGGGFDYLGLDGAPLTDRQALKRIRSLAIPPAYREVWICPDPLGHLQATGIDARGRKQYRYHPEWRASRDRAKFRHLVPFARALPRLRRRLRRDVLARGLSHDKVVAAVILLLEESLIRVGNRRYARENGHYGLTTLRRRHVEIHGSHLSFHFVGKSGVGRRVELDDRQLARIVRDLQELPGQHLFQFRDEAGALHPVASSDVNHYLRRAMGGPFSAKDFRTWAATLLCAEVLLETRATSRGRPTAGEVARCIKRVAEHLGNTPAVCRKCYIHPRIVEAYLADGLESLRSVGRAVGGHRYPLRRREEAVLALLGHRPKRSNLETQLRRSLVAAGSVASTGRKRSMTPTIDSAADRRS